MLAPLSVDGARQLLLFNNSNVDESERKYGTSDRGLLPLFLAKGHF